MFSSSHFCEQAVVTMASPSAKDLLMQLVQYYGVEIASTNRRTDGKFELGLVFDDLDSESTTAITDLIGNIRYFPDLRSRKLTKVANTTAQRKRRRSDILESETGMAPKNNPEFNVTYEKSFEDSDADYISNDDSDEDGSGFHDSTSDELIQAAKTDDELILIFKTTSGRRLGRLRRDVFTKKGRFRMKYRHLEGKHVKERKGPGGPNGVITNRPWVRWMELNGSSVQAGFVSQDAGFRRIIIAFTRASSHPPTYGQDGMFQRGATAARSWAALQPGLPALIVSIPRCRVPSKRAFADNGSGIGEMVSILNALPKGAMVEILSIGIDGLTTDLASLQWLYDA